MDDVEYTTEIMEKLAQYYLLNHKVKIEHDKQITVEGRKYVSTTIHGLFDTGMIVTTAGVDAWVKENDASKPVKQRFIEWCIMRHVSGDCGTMTIEDWLTNERDAIHDKDMRKFSAYNYDIVDSGNPTKIWIITEWNGEVTTVLFPEEY